MKITDYLLHIRDRVINDHHRGFAAFSKIKNDERADVLLPNRSSNIFYNYITAKPEEVTRDFGNFITNPARYTLPHIKNTLYHIFISNIVSALFEIAYHIAAYMINASRLFVDPILASLMTQNSLVGIKVFSERLTDLLSNINQLCRNILRLIPILGHPLGYLFDRVEMMILTAPGVKVVADEIDLFIHNRSDLSYNQRDQREIVEGWFSSYCNFIIGDHSEKMLGVDDNPTPPRCLVFGKSVELIHTNHFAL